MNAITAEMKASRKNYTGVPIPEIVNFNMPTYGQLRTASIHAPDGGSIDPNLNDRLALAAKTKDPAELIKDPMFEAAMKDPVKRAILANNSDFQSLLPQIESAFETQAKAGSPEAASMLEIVKGMKPPERTADGAGFHPQQEQRTRPQLATPTRT